MYAHIAVHTHQILVEHLNTGNNGLQLGAETNDLNLQACKLSQTSMWKRTYIYTCILFVCFAIQIKSVGMKFVNVFMLLSTLCQWQRTYMHKDTLAYWHTSSPLLMVPRSTYTADTIIDNIREFKISWMVRFISNVIAILEYNVSCITLYVRLLILRQVNYRLRW